MRPPKKNWPWLLVIPLLAVIAWAQGSPAPKGSSGSDNAGLRLLGTITWPQGSLYHQNVVHDAAGAEVLDANGRPKCRYRPMNTLILRAHGEHRVLPNIAGLTPGILLGFKSALADILWVKAEGYFHESQYERILPLCQLITWMDPRFIEVYVMGAWHMAYNFMDPRYIPAAIQFLEKGIVNNPDDAELRFEQGYTLHDKTQSFNDAVKRLGESIKMGLPTPGKRHLYAHALERAGRIDEAIAAWEQFVREETAKNQWVMASVSRHNRDLTIWRREARKLQAMNPQDVTFDYRWSVPKPRVLRIEGTTNLPVLSRIEVEVRDKDFDRLVAEHPKVYWQVGNLSLFRTRLMVKKSGFVSGRKVGNVDMDDIDLGSEPAKYPLKSDEYEVILTFNPRVQPIVVQDLTGWSGEGITGAHIQEVDGVRMIRKEFTVRRDQLLMHQEVSAR